MKRLFISVLFLSIMGSCSSEKNTKTEEVSNDEKSTPAISTNLDSPAMYPVLNQYIESIQAEMENISEERKKELQKLALYIQTKKNSGEAANLIFICTHNSRRSHMSQLWAATAANYYGIADNIFTFSGGTETTAFNPRAVAAIERAGFTVENPGGSNPNYQVRFADNGPKMECFSKIYDNPSNPQENFVAIMTCSEADKNCPFIPGASMRSPIPYEDPKDFDGTPQEQAAYDERCRQIATEMFFIMSKVKA
ncbi:protein-tyrosine-phosphatase [Aquiflexum sp. LQ15W]|uniref:protein-tyrosine-phosphatase n=1 Tax=Cognataquiflexum nitidum TaxID=2922272 RepID=UPI001F1338DB|nr:protein-tyrosine-phosphatase [Cognataquiflexum nitidum]MCH6199763.1 protein-tyrosine-phosphatase [Cognataquiflexum nitidum]